MLAMAAGCSRGTSEQPGRESPAPPPGPAANGPGGYEVTEVTTWSAIAGTITGSVPLTEAAARKNGKEPKVCGTAQRESQKLIVNQAGAVRNAVVIVQGVKRGKAMPAAAENAEIDQSKCEYSPHVQVMAVNTEIALKNSDPILHNIQFFEGDNSLFNIAQPVQGQVNKKKLEKTGTIYVECAVHGWMQGNVVVVDNPYYAVTDENGKFSITDLLPGKYQVKIWHEYLGESTREITVGAKAETTLDADLKELLAKKTAPPSATSPAAVAGNDTNAKAGNEVVVKMHEITGSAAAM